MTNKQVADIVQNILIQHFHIKADQLDMEQPLELLHADFNLLSNLVTLEQLLEKAFNKNIPLLEHISSAFHTPKDIVLLIVREL